MDISLETLVGYFVTAKTSLSSTAHIHRASAIVSEGRALLESIATHTARTTFQRTHIDSQLALLHDVHAGLAAVAKTGAREFAALVARLDAADEQITAAVAELRDTAVEPAFRPADEPSRSLESFVDEGAVDRLREAMRACLDAFQHAHADLEESNAALAGEIARIEAGLREASSPPDSPILSHSHSSHTDNDPDSASDEIESAPALFRALEAHARELADVLSSLIKHYDLCITALKHTEGGFPAAQAALPSSSSDSPATDPALDAGLASPPAPISPAERADLLRVLAADADEVAPAVREITHRLAEMETALVRLRARDDAQKAHAARAQLAVAALDALGAALAPYTAAGGAFAARWADIRAEAAAHVDELDGLRDFFAAFRRSYDGLLREVTRRLATRRNMDAIAAEARRQIDALHAVEVGERDVFLAECGEFLPADLWPGFAEPPTQYLIRVVDDGTRDIPVLSEAAVAAVRSRRAR